MADVYKGLTIAFKGDTVDFNESVQAVNKELKDLKQEFTLLNKAMKLDPTNTEKSVMCLRISQSKWRKSPRKEQCMFKQWNRHKLLMKS